MGVFREAHNSACSYPQQGHKTLNKIIRHLILRMLVRERSAVLKLRHTFYALSFKSAAISQIDPSIVSNFHIYFIFHISYLNLLRRVALRQKPFFKGPSAKNLITIYR